MSFRSIIHDMREEIGSISRKGFEVKLRSRPHRVVHDGLRPLPIEALKQSCWANMPPELLQDVLMRIEEAHDLWPHRKVVVACAGVCRSWREIMKEIVKTPEASGKLTFPISVKQPGPRGCPLQCFIKRNRTTHSFYLYICLTEASAVAKAAGSDCGPGDSKVWIGDVEEEALKLDSREADNKLGLATEDDGDPHAFDVLLSSRMRGFDGGLVVRKECSGESHVANTDNEN